MKRYWQYKLYLVFLALMYSQSIQAQETKLSKSIDRNFDVTERMNLEISNKYGNVIIETWPKNEVSVKIEILAYGKDDNAAERLMDRVEFDFKHSDDFLEIESVFDRKKSFFKDLINSIGDYSASLMSKHKLQVNYELQIPENAASITITNRFGDVHLSSLDARLNLTIAHGDVKLNNMQDYSRLNLNYGKARIKDAGELNIALKGAELELDNIYKLDLKSSSSKVKIGAVTHADLESTNDEIEITEVRDITGEVNFSNVKIQYLVESCRLPQNYGELEIENIDPNFKSIRLNGKSTDYKLDFMKNSSFQVSIYARDDKLMFEDAPGKLEKRYMDEKTKFVQLNGYVNSESTEQKLNINAQNGEVNIGFTEVLPETYNK